VRRAEEAVRRIDFRYGGRGRDLQDCREEPHMCMSESTGNRKEARRSSKSTALVAFIILCLIIPNSDIKAHPRDEEDPFRCSGLMNHTSTYTSTYTSTCTSTSTSTYTYKYTHAIYPPSPGRQAA
jgi:hypothetical protein